VGTNTLAIQVLNNGSNSSDLYMLPELLVRAETNLTPIRGYLSEATPGAQNVGPDGVILPQTVTLSRASGPFTSPFSLTLGGRITGQQIRYVLAAPSASPGAALPHPTMASTLYTSAISISSSTLIRAAVFDPTTGQKGPTITAQYLLLETGTTSNTSNFTSNLPILVGDDHGAGQPVDSGTGLHTTSMIHLFLILFHR
jgi:hypothetical protein